MAPPFTPSTSQASFSRHRCTAGASLQAGRTRVKPCCFLNSCLLCEGEGAENWTHSHLHCGHRASLTPPEVVWQIGSQSVLSTLRLFTPELSCSTVHCECLKCSSLVCGLYRHLPGRRACCCLCVQTYLLKGGTCGQDVFIFLNRGERYLLRKKKIVISVDRGCDWTLTCALARRFGRVILTCASSDSLTLWGCSPMPLRRRELPKYSTAHVTVQLRFLFTSSSWRQIFSYTETRTVLLNGQILHVAPC